MRLKYSLGTQEQTAAGPEVPSAGVTPAPASDRTPPTVSPACLRSPEDGLRANTHPALRQHFSWSPRAGCRPVGTGPGTREFQANFSAVSHRVCRVYSLRRLFARGSVSGPATDPTYVTPSLWCRGPKHRRRLHSDLVPRSESARWTPRGSPSEGPAQRPSLSAGGSREMGGGVGPAQTPTGVRKWLLRAVRLF